MGIRRREEKWQKAGGSADQMAWDAVTPRLAGRQAGRGGVRDAGIPVGGWERGPHVWRAELACRNAPRGFQSIDPPLHYEFQVEKDHYFKYCAALNTLKRDQYVLIYI